VKAQERHHLKQNEFAMGAARVATSLSENRSRLVPVLIAAVIVAAAIVGFVTWQNRAKDRAGAALGEALSIAQSPIAPPPTVPGATQAPGTYPSEQARQEASIQAFQRVATEFASSDAGIVARYHLGGAFLAAGRAAEAEQAFRQVADAGSNVYSAPARLGIAEALLAQSKFDDAIKTLTELSSDRNGPLPVDGVLMQLARAYGKAGKAQEARATYKRIVDEFPESMYVAEARQQMTALG
jgi:TolA-binding protein